MGEDSEFQRLQTTLTVLLAKFDYVQSDVAAMKVQMTAFADVPGLVSALARDVERIQRQIETDRRDRPTQQIQLPVGMTAALLVMVAISAAVVFAAVYLGGRLGQ